MENSKKGNWTSPFNKFSWLKVNDALNTNIWLKVNDVLNTNIFI